jgi:two-component system response regulator CpxR
MHKILVADDEEELHLLIKAALKDYDIQIHSVYNGCDALDEIYRHHYDLVLLDILMPKGSGGDFMRATLGRATLPPIVMISAMNDATLIKNALGIGAAAFIVKPIDTTELRSTIKKLLKC